MMNLDVSVDLRNQSDEDFGKAPKEIIAQLHTCLFYFSQSLQHFCLLLPSSTRHRNINIHKCFRDLMLSNFNVFKRHGSMYTTHLFSLDLFFGTSNLLKLENLLRFTRLEDFFKYRVHSTYTWSTQVHSYGLQLKFLLRLSNHCHGTYCNKQITTICPSPLSECVFCYLQHDHAEPGAARSF